MMGSQKRTWKGDPEIMGQQDILDLETVGREARSPINKRVHANGTRGG